MKTPLLFLIFNRPELTFRVFEEIRNAKPQQLFIAADGPREGKEGEAEKCEQARSIVNKIDWNCEVKTLFRNKNLGCRDAVSSAITWFFSHVEEGIILEDDCLPDKSFFLFCSALLEKYRNNENIMHISGANFQKGKKRGTASYYFSVMPLIWGWASWRRAWKHYSVDMKGLENYIQDPRFINIFKKKYFADFYCKKLIQTQNGNINTWDYQWAFAVWKNKGICITPNENLVTNIGFGTDATHTLGMQNDFAALPMGKIENLIHPQKINIDYKADEYFWRIQTGISSDFLHYKKIMVGKLMKYGSQLKQKF